MDSALKNIFGIHSMDDLNMVLKMPNEAKIIEKKSPSDPIPEKQAEISEQDIRKEVSKSESLKENDTLSIGTNNGVIPDFNEKCNSTYEVENNLEVFQNVETVPESIPSAQGLIKIQPGSELSSTTIIDDNISAVITDDVMYNEAVALKIETLDIVQENETLLGQSFSDQTNYSLDKEIIDLKFSSKINVTATGEISSSPNESVPSEISMNRDTDQAGESFDSKSDKTEGYLDFNSLFKDVDLSIRQSLSSPKKGNPARKGYAKNRENMADSGATSGLSKTLSSTSEDSLAGATQPILSTVPTLSTSPESGGKQSETEQEDEIEDNVSIHSSQTPIVTNRSYSYLLRSGDSSKSIITKADAEQSSEGKSASSISPTRLWFIPTSLIADDTVAQTDYKQQNDIQKEATPTMGISTPYSASHIQGESERIKISDRETGCTAEQSAEDTFQISIRIPNSSVRQVVEVTADPDMLLQWCESLSSLELLNVGERELDLERDSKISSRLAKQLDAEWIEATATYRLPGQHKKGCFRKLHERIERSTTRFENTNKGTLTVYVDRRRGQIALSLSNFDGCQVSHTMKFVQANNDVHISDIVCISPLQQPDSAQVNTMERSSGEVDTSRNNNGLCDKLVSCPVDCIYKMLGSSSSEPTSIESHMQQTIQSLRHLLNLMTLADISTTEAVDSGDLATPLLLRNRISIP